MEADVYEIMRTVALVCSAIVSLTSALIAFFAVRSQRNMAKHTANLTRLNRAADLVPDSPELLALHGIKTDQLHKEQVSEKEIIYLLYLFEAGEIYYTLEGSRKIDLRTYRKIMLDQPKVRFIWRKYLDEKIFHETPFTRAVNSYIDDNYPRERYADAAENACNA